MVGVLRFTKSFLISNRIAFKLFIAISEASLLICCVGIMAHSKDYIDVTLFQSLNHEVLAQHVIPDTFVGAGDNAYAARKDCAENVVEYFKRNLSFVECETCF